MNINAYLYVDKLGVEFPLTKLTLLTGKELRDNIVRVEPGLAKSNTWYFKCCRDTKYYDSGPTFLESRIEESCKLDDQFHDCLVINFFEGDNLHYSEINHFIDLMYRDGNFNTIAMTQSYDVIQRAHELAIPWENSLSLVRVDYSKVEATYVPKVYTYEMIDICLKSNLELR